MDGGGEQRGRREEGRKVGGERKSKPKAEGRGEWKKMGRNLFDFGGAGLRTRQLEKGKGIKKMMREGKNEEDEIEMMHT